MKTVVRTLVIALAVAAGASAVSAMPKQSGAKVFFDQLSRTGS
jgi:Spy/CpxP family protein refolding chaperone